MPTNQLDRDKLQKEAADNIMNPWTRTGTYAGALTDFLEKNMRPLLELNNEIKRLAESGMLAAMDAARKQAEAARPLTTIKVKTCITYSF